MYCYHPQTGSTCSQQYDELLNCRRFRGQKQLRIFERRTPENIPNIFRQHITHQTPHARKPQSTPPRNLVLNTLASSCVPPIPASLLLLLLLLRGRYKAIRSLSCTSRWTLKLWSSWRCYSLSSSLFCQQPVAKTRAQYLVSKYIDRKYVLIKIVPGT